MNFGMSQYQTRFLKLFCPVFHRAPKLDQNRIVYHIGRIRSPVSFRLKFNWFHPFWNFKCEFQLVFQSQKWSNVLYRYHRCQPTIKMGISIPFHSRFFIYFKRANQLKPRTAEQIFCRHNLSSGCRSTICPCTRPAIGQIHMSMDFRHISSASRTHEQFQLI